MDIGKHEPTSPEPGGDRENAIAEIFNDAAETHDREAKVAAGYQAKADVELNPDIRKVLEVYAAQYRRIAMLALEVGNDRIRRLAEKYDRPAGDDGKQTRGLWKA